MQSSDEYVLFAIVGLFCGNAALAFLKDRLSSSRAFASIGCTRFSDLGISVHYNRKGVYKITKG